MEKDVKDSEILDADYRVEPEVNKFVDAFNGISMKRYEQALRMAYESAVAQSDNNFAEGSHEVAKIVVPLARSATILAAKSAAASYKDTLRTAGKAGAKLDKALLEKKFALEKLDLSKSSLKKELKDIGLTRKERHIVLKNKDYYKGLFLLRDELKELSKGSKYEKVVNSSDFFFMNKKGTAKLLSYYMKHSRDDSIRNISGWERKTHKSLKKFLKKADKNGVSANGKQAIAMMDKLNKMRRHNGLASKMINRNIAYSFYKAKQEAKDADDNGKIGAEKLARSVQMTFVGYKVLIGKNKCGPVALPIRVGLKVALKLGSFTDAMFVKYNLMYRRSIAKKIAAAKKAVSSTVMSAVVSSKKAIKYQVKKGGKVVSSSIKSRKTVQAIRSANKKAMAQASKVAKSKAAKEAVAVSKKLGKAGAKVGKVTFTVGNYGFIKPIKGVRSGVGNFFSLCRKLKMVIIVASAIILSVYILISQMFALAQAMDSQGGLSSTVILGPEDTSVYDKVVYLQGKLDGRKASAKERGEGVPKTTAVAADQSIDRYGHPEIDEDGNEVWTKGYKIYYEDSSGNLMADGTNNIKDIIILAYVGEDGEWEEEDDLDSNIDDYWEYLNPELTDDDLIETDIYSCANGCTDYEYYCNDSSCYDHMNRINTEGGHVHGSVVSQTSDGCKSRVVKKRGIRFNPMPEPYEYEDIEYYCPGHKVRVCYGHRDVEIHLRTWFMADAFREEHVCGSWFSETFSTWDKDQKEWANTLYDQDWFDLYGIDPLGGYGFIAEASYSDEEIEEILASLDVDATRKGIVERAVSMVGMVPYYWGGKPLEYGVYPFKTSAGGMVGDTVGADKKGRTAAGLDCYGFVMYCYNSSVNGLLPVSTTQDLIDQNGFGLKRISASSLQPGDIGVFYKNGSGGHVGIFYGYDDDGNALWIHCTGQPRNNVVVSTCGFDNYFAID